MNKRVLAVLSLCSTLLTGAALATGEQVTTDDVTMDATPGWSVESHETLPIFPNSDIINTHRSYHLMTDGGDGD